MLNKDMGKAEIENFLKDKGDFVAIDHLTRLVKEKEIPTDRKKFVYLRLAKLYEKSGLLKEAAKMYNNAAIISIAYTEKIENYVKEAEMCIKAGEFEAASEATKKAMGEGNVSQRAEVFVKIKQFYKDQAEVLVKAGKNGNAARIYERLLQMNISDVEREEIKSKLRPIYEKLGKIRDLNSLNTNKLNKKHF